MTEAIKTAPPIADAKIKNGDEYEIIGQVWGTTKEGVTSVRLTRPVDSFILVNRTPKPKPKTAQPS
jgi:hypothetical protein